MARRAKPSNGGLAVSAPSQDYQAEDDCRTMERAEEVRADPARQKRAATYARGRMAVMSKIVGGTARGKARGKAPSRGRMRGR